ncbi:hypothetical protein [Candidatus Hodarchaeum mangrovi]
MEIEFNGISGVELRTICDNNGLSNAEILPLSRRDTICPKEEIQEFGDGESYYLIEESCWRGYYFCGDVQCGRTPTHRPAGTAASHPISQGRVGRKYRGRSSSSPGCDCSGTDCSSTSTDCEGSNSDSLGAIAIFLLIIAIIVIIIWLLPFLIPIFIGLANLGLAILFALFDLLSFGIFRKRYKRVLVHFPQEPSRDQLKKVIADSASMGGLPRRNVPYLNKSFYSNGFWLLRTGTYLVIPAMFATILVIIIHPSNNFIFFAPIVSFCVALFLVLFGNFLVGRKAKAVTQLS